MSPEKETKKMEDDYFARIEFERRQKRIIEQQKNMLNEEKKKLKDQHWMHCPKCGMEMVEIDFEGIKLDRCSSCLGLYFDEGEVVELIRKNKPGFLSRLSTLFRD
jgi:hypothetical protein